MDNILVINSESELANLEELTLEYIVHSKAENTTSAYNKDWADFEQWAGMRKQKTRPATPETVALYITSLAHDGRKPSTIARRLVAISQKHKASGFDTPTQAQIVRATVAGIRRAHGVARDKKSPMLTEHIREWINRSGDDLLAKRDKALVLLGFAGAFRRSELVGLNLDDLEFTSQGIIVTLRKSKTDQEGEGRKIGIPFGKMNENGDPGYTCPVQAVVAWIQAANIEGGSLFRPVRRGGHVGAGNLTDRAVSLIIKKACGVIGLNPDRFGGHSLRAGHATQATNGGASELATMRQTGHKSTEVFRGYIRDAALFQNNSANSLDL